MGKGKGLLFSGIGGIGGAVAVFVLLAPTGMTPTVIGLYLAAIAAGGAAGSFTNDILEILQEYLRQKPNILLIGIGGVGKTTVVNEFQEASESGKAAIVGTEKIENNIIYLTNQKFNIWDYAGQQPSQIIDILNKLDNNIVIIPLFVVDVCPPKNETENMEGMPEPESLSIQDHIVQKRIAQQQAELSDTFCQTILGSINNLSKIKTVGYLVNKIDLLDRDSQAKIFQSELPALKYLERISANGEFYLKKKAGSALKGLNIRKLLREIASGI